MIGDVVIEFSCGCKRDLAAAAVEEYGLKRGGWGRCGLHPAAVVVVVWEEHAFAMTGYEQ